MTQEKKKEVVKVGKEKKPVNAYTGTGENKVLVGSGFYTHYNSLDLARKELTDEFILKQINRQQKTDVRNELARVSELSLATIVKRTQKELPADKQKAMENEIAELLKKYSK